MKTLLKVANRIITMNSKEDEWHKACNSHVSVLETKVLVNYILFLLNNNKSYFMIKLNNASGFFKL